MKNKHILLFWSKVDKEKSDIFYNDTRCWEWIAGKDHDGYGRFNIKPNKYGAHRISWLLYYGEIPENMFVLHHCDNPACVNPLHLFLGNQQDNEDDKVRKNRQSHGEQHGRHKLTEKQVSEIRERYSNGSVSYMQLAKEYGISKALVCFIISKKLWVST